ncbi:uncharacterized protein DFL_006484 [Arthrobotrys flagrans]|uniref:Uncharacterized protein n=1 Tax=Arthrobotrys flagrans TaxID=97331 RepID=A0A437A0K6_ARTFL|nr:hypothetical protein DFL_006484 [Arthrobotrys flagrans]
MLSQSSLAAAAASDAECEKAVFENPFSPISTSVAEDMPFSKRVKLSEIKHNMGIENIPSNDDSSDLSCSTLSAPEEFDAVPAIVNATEYVKEHLQPSVLCHDTELSLQSSEPLHRLSTNTLESLAQDLKFSFWKFDSIKTSGSLLVFGNDDSAPLSDVAGPLGSRSRIEGIVTTPQTFNRSPVSWKVASAENDCFVFLETVRGVPPETFMWTDDQHGAQINPTNWISSTPKRKGVYHYSSQLPVADRFFQVLPNYVCGDSKKSAACMLVQRKGYKRPGHCTDAETKGQKRSRPI